MQRLRQHRDTAAAHASVSELKRMIEQRIPEDRRRILLIRYEPGREYPDAAIVKAAGMELRLEKDYLDSLWTVATNEEHPRLLARFEDAQLGDEALHILESCCEQLVG